MSAQDLFPCKHLAQTWNLLQYLVTHFERLKVQRQVKLSIALCMWHLWLEFFVQSLLNRTSTCPAGYTHVVWHVLMTRMVLSSEARESQQLLMFASWSITICAQVHEWPFHEHCQSKRKSTVCVSGLHTPISKCSGCSACIHIMNVVTNNMCLFLVLAASALCYSLSNKVVKLCTGPLQYQCQHINTYTVRGAAYW